MNDGVIDLRGEAGSRYSTWEETKKDDKTLADVLAERFPEACHKTLPKEGGKNVTYVEVWDYQQRLNQTVGVQGWDSQVRLEAAGGKLIATLSLTILGVTKTNLGDEDAEKESWGGAATAAYAQAFKRAAAGFGMGLYMYEPTFDQKSPQKPASDERTALRQEVMALAAQSWGPKAKDNLFRMFARHSDVPEWDPDTMKPSIEVLEAVKKEIVEGPPEEP